jgi:hypothetical protein
MLRDQADEVEAVFNGCGLARQASSATGDWVGQVYRLRR